VPVLALEVLLLRLAEMPRLVAIEDILAGRMPAPSIPMAEAPPQRGRRSRARLATQARCSRFSRRSAVPLPSPLSKEPRP
jgi:hypothetical protein